MISEGRCIRGNVVCVDLSRSIGVLHEKITNLIIVLIASALLFPVCSSAQVLEEVIVTAQKRAQNIQDVGIAITAFTGDQIKELGFTNSMDLVSMTPGLQFAGASNATTNTFAIRGVMQQDWTDHQESAVAVYVDEAYIASMTGTSFLLFDLDRVEVLKGPQGTLFGRNATGGLVHYITAKPTEEYEGYGNLTYGSYNQVRFEGALSGPLTRQLSGRLSFVVNRHDPYVENRIGPDLAEDEHYAIRGQLKFQVSDALEVLVSAHGATQDITTGWYEAAPSRPTADDDAVFTPGLGDFFGYEDTDRDPFTVDADFSGFSDISTYGITGHITWDIGKLTLVSITDFENYDKSYKEDSEVSPNAIFDFLLQSDINVFSQELRLSESLEKTRWVGGAYYLNIDGDYLVGGDDVFVDAGIPRPSLLRSDYSTKAESLSFFFQMEYDLTEQLTIIGGARYIDEEKDHSYFSRGLGNLAEVGQPSFLFNKTTVGDLAEQNSSLWAAKAEMDWKPKDDWLVYASFNRGTKAGGFNAPLDPSGLFDSETGAQINTAMKFDEEVLYAYEIGFKSVLFDGNTRLNAAAYYYDYEDFQAFDFRGLTQIVFNADAKIKGFEVDLITNPWEGLELMLGLSVLDTKVHDVPVGTKIVDVEMSYSPKINLNGLIRYTWPAFQGSMTVQGDFQYVDDHYFNVSNFSTTFENGYWVENARIRYLSADESWELAFFVKNLADSEYRVFAADVSSSFGMTENYYAKPRWFGATYTYRWN